MNAPRLLLLTFLAAAALAVEPARAEVQPAVDADRWIVVLTDPRSDRRRSRGAGGGYGGRYNYAEDPILTRLAEGIASDFDLEIDTQWPVRSLAVHCVVVSIPRDVETTLDALRADERVEWVQPFNEFEGLSMAAADQTDPYQHLQGSLETLNVAPLQTRLSGAGISIVVIDSGVEADHPDLEHAIVERLDFVGDGMSAERHGTGVAGVMVAAHDNGEGISGIAPGVSLHTYRACWEIDGEGTRCNSLTLSMALDRAVDAGPHILNLSLTGPKDPLLDRLVDRVLAGGALIVIAHDAEARPDARFPSPRQGVVTVASNSMPAVAGPGTIVAPGDDVLTSQPGHSYDFMTGSSLSAAHVSAVLALILEAEPQVSGRDAVAHLEKSIRAVDGGVSIDACSAALGLGYDVTCR
ncbi:MAG: S8 family serine peptidase [Woeseiaceae bacterium]|nr:S8 family serine peptidase [Woeseiaceae bacterium]